MSRKIACSICNCICDSDEKLPMCSDCLRIDHEKNSKRPCYHCGLFKIPIKKRWGRLCKECELDKDIKELYYRIHSEALRELKEAGKTFPLPSEPTNAPPGSEEKIKVLQKRAKERVQLFHPDDEVNINHLSKIIQVINRRIKHANNNETSYSRTGKESRDSKREFHCSLEYVH